MTLATRPRPTVNHRKRQAQHHRHSKDYLRTYWPYLPMLLIVCAGLLVNTMWPRGNVLGSQSDFTSSSLLSDTNAQRANDEETALSLNPQLSSAAQAKADDMVRSDYWAHTSPSGKTPWTFITASGYQYQAAGENLAYGFVNASDAVAGWMNSPEHRANILNGTYSDVGFGVASSPDYLGHGPATLIVAEYARPAGIAGVSTNGASQVLGTETVSQPIARIQVLTGGQPVWALAAVVGLAGLAGAYFLLHHGFKLKRTLNKGEAFIVHHPYLDITVVFLITAGCVLTRISGIIR
ncbi:MAG TPA: CAP domain-containing protein [Verrucomicrobiae bacterium]|nr:CAP domain-containing protein [Verrucomicrobiae bacterium]